MSHALCAHLMLKICSFVLFLQYENLHIGGLHEDGSVPSNCIMDIEVNYK